MPIATVAYSFVALLICIIIDIARVKLFRNVEKNIIDSLEKRLVHLANRVDVSKVSLGIRDLVEGKQK